MQIWQEVLGISQVGIYDNFFDLGGHSLLATKMITRIRESLDIDLPLTAAFRSLTIDELAHTVDELQAAKVDEELADTILDQLENLSEQEIEELLNKQAFAGTADTTT